MLDMAERKKPRTKHYARGSWAARLQRIVADSGKSHDEFAAGLNISTRTLRAWLYGEREPGKIAAQLIELRFGKNTK